MACLVFLLQVLHFRLAPGFGHHVFQQLWSDSGQKIGASPCCVILPRFLPMKAAEDREICLWKPSSGIYVSSLRRNMK